MKPVQVFDGNGIDPVPENVRKMQRYAKRWVRAQELAELHDVIVELEDYQTWSPNANKDNHDEILLFKIEEMFGPHPEEGE